MLIAVSSSFAFTIELTAEIAAAPHIPVPAASKNIMDEFVLKYLFNKYMSAKLNKITAAPSGIITQPSLIINCRFNLNPYKTIAKRSSFLAEKVMPGRKGSGY